MGIDVYLTWDGQSEEEKEAQHAGFFVPSGAGVLRESYHGGPYATRVLVPEAWANDTRDGHDYAVRIPIEASILRERLPKTVLVAIYRNHVVYGEALENPGLIRLASGRDIDDGLTSGTDIGDFFRKVSSSIENADKETQLAVDQITPEHLRGIQELIAKRALPSFALAFVDFVELCERKEAETGKTCKVVVDY
jgi:hypothetical protein